MIFSASTDSAISAASPSGVAGFRSEGSSDTTWRGKDACKRVGRRDHRRGGLTLPTSVCAADGPPGPPGIGREDLESLFQSPLASALDSLLSSLGSSLDAAATS